MADLTHPKLAIFRRVFTVLSVISMVLCLAVLIFWCRSYYAHEQLLYYRIEDDSHHLYWLENNAGYVIFSTNQLPVPRGNTDQSSWQYHRYPQTGNFAGPGGPGNGTNVFVRTIFGFRFGIGIAIRHWLFALAFAVLPATRLISAFRTRRRHRIGLCSACGYDLRASPGRCPECGAIGRRSEVP